MTQREVRNALVSGLHKHLKVPVYKSDQVRPEAAPPYVIYAVTAPYIPGRTLGTFSVSADGKTKTRREEAGMSLSFTACGMNRETKAGYVFGEDEAVTICEKAQGWFLLEGQEALDTCGIVVESIGNASSRSVLMVDEEASRYGFDVTVRYIREDAAPVKTIKKINCKGEI